MVPFQTYSRGGLFCKHFAITVSESIPRGTAFTCILPLELVKCMPCGMDSLTVIAKCLQNKTPPGLCLKRNPYWGIVCKSNPLWSISRKRGVESINKKTQERGLNIKKKLAKLFVDDCIIL